MGVIGAMAFEAAARDVIGELRAENKKLRAAVDKFLEVCDRGGHDSYDIYRACEFARSTCPALNPQERAE